jgi:hypothetical protein
MTKTQTATIAAQRAAAMRIIITIGEMIQDAGQIPSGHLYAMLMPTGLSLESYNRIITTLVKCKVITQENFLLTWIGPGKETNGTEPLPLWLTTKGEGQ